MLILFLVFLTGCMSDQKTATVCTGDQTYSSNERACIEDVGVVGNHRPVAPAPPSTVTFTEGDAAVFFSLSTGTDSDGDLIEYYLDTAPSGGTLKECLGLVGSSGYTDLSCRFEPNSDFSGTDTFTYKLYDGQDFSLSTTTISLVGTAVEDPPLIVSVPNDVYTDEDTTITIYYTIDEGGGSDEDSDGLNVNVSSSNTAVVADSDITISWGGSTLGNGGSTIGVGDSTASGDSYPLVVQLVPKAEVYGTPTTITLTLTDTAGSVTDSTVDINLSIVNDVPFFTTPDPSSVSIVEGTPIPTINVVVDEGGASDEDSQNLTLYFASSNTNLIDPTKIYVDFDCFDGTPQNFSGNVATPISLEVVGVNCPTSPIDASAVSGGINLMITPEATPYGTADIDLVLSDGTNTVSLTYNIALAQITPDEYAQIINLDHEDSPDYYWNEDEPTEMKLEFQIDEGNTSDSDSLYINVLLDDSTCVNHLEEPVVTADEIDIYWGTTLLGHPDGEWMSVGDGASSGDSQNITMYFTPAANINTTGIGDAGALEGVDCYIEIKVSDYVDADDDYETVPVAYAEVDIQIVDVNDVPIVNVTPNITTNENSFRSFDFTVEKGGGATESDDSIDITIVSSDPSILPDENIHYYIEDGAGGYWDDERYGGVPINVTDTDEYSYTVNVDVATIEGQTGDVSLIIYADDYSEASPEENAPLSATAIATITIRDHQLVHSDYSMIQAVGPDMDIHGNTLETANVKLKWGAMSFGNADSSLTGFKVYKSEEDPGLYNTIVTGGEIFWDSFTINGSADYDEEDGTTLVKTIDLTDADTAGDYEYEESGLAAGTPVWYSVRAIDGYESLDLVTSGGPNYSVKVHVPPKNMALLHRRVANKEMCDIIKSTTDPTNGNRCLYKGPGDVWTSGSNYYDVEYDHWIDRYEAGCPYTSPNLGGNCSTAGCINNGDPNDVTLSPNVSVGIGSGFTGSAYYNRKSGECFVDDDGAGNWLAFTAANLPAAISTYQDFTSKGLPPLVHTSVDEALALCDALDDVDGSGSSYDKELMTRKIQIAASAWDIDYNYNKVNLLEDGGDLSVISRCNSTMTNGLSYSDNLNLAQAQIDTLPGMGTDSTIRTVLTGSNATEACQSRHGIQDLVGNVSEWASDTQIACAADEECTNPGGGIFDFDGGAGFYDFTHGGTDYYGPCGFDGGACDNKLEDWSITDTSNDVDVSVPYFFVPAGLPAMEIHQATPLAIGSGVSGSVFHKDTFDVNATEINAGSDVGYMTTGGSVYPTPDATAGAFNAGRFSADFHEKSASRHDVGFRCMVPLIP
jgi:hypothetical protein